MLTQNSEERKVKSEKFRCRGGACSAQRGITLLSLIITIIVMLILVAVTITMAVNGGLFQKAEESVGEMENAIAEEQQLASGKIQIDNTWYDSMEDYIDGYPTGTTKPYNKTEKDENGCVTVNATYESDALTAIIPSGFKVSEKTGETSIKEGLVIKDKDGNEFVWIPCTTDANDNSGVTLYAQDKQYNDGTKATKQYEYTNYSDWIDAGGDAASVSKNGGFYVGRYEAGIPSDAPFFCNTDGATYTTSGRNTASYVPVSKPNNPSWNYISHVNAKIVSQAMYANSSSVKSNLIDSYAWDTIVNWMESKEEGIAKDSTDYGNCINSKMSLTDVLYAEHVLDYTTWTWKTIANNYRKGALEITSRNTSGEQTLYELATGTTENTKVLNIYDMAGNLFEWTTEVGYHDAGTDATQYAVHRGGYYGYSGSINPVSHRDGDFWASEPRVGQGFRVVLYIK